MNSPRSIFDNATLRLTLWYMLILMTFSVVFSSVLFRMASEEFGRTLGPGRPGETRIFIDDDRIVTWRQQRIDESNARLISNLVLINLCVLLGGGALSYLLARRTLEPIEATMESQARFTSDAAHELRTPLAVMQTGTEVALRDHHATKKSHEAVLQSNLDEIHRLRLLTDRLLMLANEHEIELVPVAVDDAANEAMNRSIVIAQTKHISIDNRVGRHTALAHQESLTDTLTILIDNAIKYSPAKSIVTLTSEVRDRIVTITVKDEGIGIDPHDRDHIFERFYRADSSRSKRNIEGHGLGLSIAERLISRQHGKITVESTPGKGSEFCVHLPAAH